MPPSRKTAQQAAIQAALATAEGPLLPEEVLELAQADCPSLGAATVYRTLRRLREAGDVEEVVTPDQRVRYELPSAHHHHFQCRVCDRVYDVPGCPDDASVLGARMPRGFRVELHEVLLVGVCADRACAS